jgi:hypothetical protein
VTTVAALFVDPTGPYPCIPGVECWFEAPLFDARRYPGPHAVVVHPPCARWSKLAKFCQARFGRAVGEDEGLFAHALAMVRRYGGVLEHPAWSLAWPAHGLVEPPRDRSWLQVNAREYVCEVHQSAYGHRAKKPTWLFYVGDAAPDPADSASPPATMTVGSATLRNGTWTRRASVERMGGRERRITPEPFARYLVSLARSSYGGARTVSPPG